MVDGPATDSEAGSGAGGAGAGEHGVVVVGAGPVGLAVALFLARFGVATTVLEAEPRRVAIGSRSICTQRDVLDLLDRLDCADPILAEGVTWTVGRTYHRDVEVLTTAFPLSGTGRGALPPFVNIPQTSVERHLDDRVAAEPLVTVRRNARVTGLGQEPDGVRVTLADGGQVVAAWLVGADGPRSTVRAALEVPFEGHSFDDQFLICDIRAELDFPLERRFYFDPPWNPGRQVLVHPQPDHVWRIDWQVPRDFDLDADRANGALDRRIRQIAGDRPYEVVWASRYRFHQRLAASYRVGRCFLVGDAAHLMAPFGARGLNSGLQDAENLAWKLAHVIHGWAPERLLDTYHDERHAAGAENVAITGATMRFLVPQTDAERAHRHRVLDASRTDPQARRQIDSGQLAAPFAYVDSPLTTPPTQPSGAGPTTEAAPESTPDGRAGVGRTESGGRTATPGWLAPDGPCATVVGDTRLRRTFGPHWTLLVFGDGTDAAAAELAVRSLGQGGDGGAPPVALRRVLRRAEDPLRPDDVLDSDGALHAAYLPDGAPAGGRSWLVRPDGHLAAAVDPRDGVAALRAALRRTTGGR